MTSQSAESNKPESQMSHTPGPWTVSGESIVTEGHCIAVIEDDGGYEAPSDERKANASLIAAAPTLLEACKVAYCKLVEIDDRDAAIQLDGRSYRPQQFLARQSDNKNPRVGLLLGFSPISSLSGLNACERVTEKGDAVTKERWLEIMLGLAPNPPLFSFEHHNNRPAPVCSKCGYAMPVKAMDEHEKQCWSRR